MTPSDDNNNHEPNHAVMENRALLRYGGGYPGAGWILVPFYGAIMWGPSLRLLFAPVYRRLLARLKFRRTLAALLTWRDTDGAVLPFALLTPRWSKKGPICTSWCSRAS